MLGYRSLKLPDPTSPQYWADSSVWWDNWAHNFVLSMVLCPVVVAVIVVVAVTMGT